MPKDLIVTDMSTSGNGLMQSGNTLIHYQQAINWAIVNQVQWCHIVLPGAK